MSQPFLGEIRLWALNYNPVGWAFCNGASMSVAQNSALFSLLGTTYGGDGRINFHLPDLRGRVPIHQGQGPGLTNRQMGQKGGTETETVTSGQMPAHKHNMFGEEDVGTTPLPGPNFLIGELEINSQAVSFYSTSSPSLSLSADALSTEGGTTSRPNLMPYLTMNYCIATVGIFPTRT